MEDVGGGGDAGTDAGTTMEDVGGGRDATEGEVAALAVAAVDAVGPAITGAATGEEEEGPE